MEGFIRFMAPVVPITCTALIEAIDQKLREDCECIHLFMSSIGGSVHHCLSIYNFLRGAPVEVYTYNFGSLDSIGVVIFCAGDKRFTVPHSRFLIHGVKLNLQRPVQLDEHELGEMLESIKIDYKNIAKVIADTTGQTTEKVEADMNNRTTLNPEQAMEYKLVDEIKTELFPTGTSLLTIDEDIIQRQQEHITMVEQSLTPPDTRGYIRSNYISHGTYFNE